MKKQIQKSRVNEVDRVMTYCCFRCKWEWVPRKLDPSACPHCKSYDWRELIPNAETKKAIKEARKGKGLMKSKNAKELLENLSF